MTRKMKDSGVEWIGKIPEEWKLVKVKYLFRLGRGRVIAQTELEDDGHYPVYSSQTKNNGCLGYIRTYDFDTSQLTWTTDGANAGTIFLREGKHNCTNVCGTLLPNTNNNLKFLKYDLEYTAIYHKRQDTNGYKIMNNEMAEIQIVLPSLKEEQINIANYLDAKCTKIDQTIEKQKQVIEKLKEYKQSIITEAVTKGLNPDVKMKDSGIKWIGEIPEGWKVIRLRYLGRCQNGISKSAGSFGRGFPFVSYGDIYKNLQLPNSVEGLVDSSESDRKIYSVEEGDIFFTRTSETIEEIGLSCVCKIAIKNATFAGFLIRVRPMYNNLYVDYSKYYFSSKIHRKFFVKEMNLVTRASLSQELLKKLPVLLPSIEEQKQIANYLDKKCTSIDKSISKKQKLIEKLTEYKKSLIYECVTGKKEV